VLVPFPRQGRSIRCQGQLEAATAQILVASPLVESIDEQPFKIWYSWTSDTEVQLQDGPPIKKPKTPEFYSYIVPDFLVRLRSGDYRLIEVKPARKLQRLDVSRKLLVAEQFAAKNAWTFHVVTEHALFAGALLRNVRLLNRFRRAVAPALTACSLRELVAAKPRSIRELATTIVNDASVLTAKSWILHLVATGELALDPRASPISDETLIFPGGSILWEPFDSLWEPSGSSTAKRSELFGNSVRNNSLPKI